MSLAPHILSASSRQRARLAATENVQAALDLHEREKQERMLAKRGLKWHRVQFMLAATKPPKMFVSCLQRAIYQGPHARPGTEDAERVRWQISWQSPPLPWERLSGRSQETPPYWGSLEILEVVMEKSRSLFPDGARAASRVSSSSSQRTVQQETAHEAMTFLKEAAATKPSRR